MTNSIIVQCAVLLIISCAGCRGMDPDNKEEKIHGCGGFVRSPFKLEFQQIEMKLYTKQGSLAMKTECAPQTGYYFIPLDRFGDYVLKINPPEGWTFSPQQYEISFDGNSDPCSQEKDLNFDFKGFSIYGQVVSSGYSEGPNGVQISLTGSHDVKMTTTTGKQGMFSFEEIPMGQYVIKATHPDLVFENDKHSFEISNKNVVINDKIKVSGYVVTGKIFSDSKPVEGVSVIMYGKPNSKVPGNCLPAEGKIDIKEESGAVVVCHRVSDSTGTFQFIGVSPGSYTLVPVYRGKNIIYTVSPEKMKIELKHESLTLKTNFHVEGFTVKGAVAGVKAGATILVNGKQAATTLEDGSFTLAKMKPGTYEFLVLSEKLQFDAVKVEITAGNPVISTFTPARFLMCGDVILNQPATSSSKLSLVLQPVGKNTDTETRTEVIRDPSNVCLFLPKGQYQVSVAAENNLFFQPTKIRIDVPTKEEHAFTFKQFLGHISGVIQCPLGCSEGITVNLEQGGKIIKQTTFREPTNKNEFKFVELDSGEYYLSLGENSKYCWEQDGKLAVTLKDANIQNVQLRQRGFKLAVSATHMAIVKIIPMSETLTLQSGENIDLCLRNAEVHTFIPSSCHIFENAEYKIKPGTVAEIKFKAVQHTVSGTITAKEKIDDLKVSVNGQLLNNGKAIGSTTKNSAGDFEYRIEFGQTPQQMSVIKFMSVGFSFDTSEVTVNTADDCQLNAFQVRALKAHIIKGKLIPPLEDVQIRIDLVGETSEPTFVVTNSNGEYVGGPFIHSSGFQVTAKKSGYTFKSLPGDEYSFSVHQLAKIQIKVIEEVPGQALTSVLLSLSGPNAYRQNRYTNANGEMSFTDLQAGQYYLKALLKEFRFEPSAVSIQLLEQETKTVTITAKRESFSLYGQLNSLNGEIIPNLLVSAKGTGACAEYGEEGLSDEVGNFRIWALKSSCVYTITVGNSNNNDGVSKRVERTIPSSLEVLVGEEDIKDVSFMILSPVTRMDVSLRCRTKKTAYLDSLKVYIYSSRSPDSPLHRVTFNGYPFTILPQIPKDGSEYFITFETSLNEAQYNYKLPNVINFLANESFAHYTFDFPVEPAPLEQDIGKSSYIAMTVVLLVIIASMYFESIVKLIKASIENSTGGITSGSSSRKGKIKSK